METLLSVAEREHVEASTIEEMKRIKSELAEDKKNDIYKFKDEIKTLLLGEIVSRYYFQKGRVEALLKHDNELKKAVELLNNEAEYKKILGK